MLGLLRREKREPRTRSRLSFSDKTDCLRRYETYSYQIAFYLLQNEGAARLAAERTLLELYRSDSWFQLETDPQTAQVKREAMRQSLLVRRSLLT
ncbi:hypothetical protein [Paenibacillus sp. YYML68]|uniref:hypothetical protein n=1 Tax=Paenibacillus sp. YYML68 TaxID=2909250 RepID=UPI002493A325|nr:hypothetical protein [Paenibacillus sp. YYML68]